MAVDGMARPKKYIIKLSDDERTALQKTIKNKNICKTVLKRCQILLELWMKIRAQGLHTLRSLTVTLFVSLPLQMLFSLT